MISLLVLFWFIWREGKRHE